MPDALEDQIAELLEQGYGAEDIAARLDNSVDSVRHRIKIMRRDGRLTKIYPIKMSEGKNA